MAPEPLDGKLIEELARFISGTQLPAAQAVPEELIDLVGTSPDVPKELARAVAWRLVLHVASLEEASPRPPHYLTAARHLLGLVPYPTDPAAELSDVGLSKRELVARFHTWFKSDHDLQRPGALQRRKLALLAGKYTEEDPRHLSPRKWSETTPRGAQVLFTEFLRRLKDELANPEVTSQLVREARSAPGSVTPSSRAQSATAHQDGNDLRGEEFGDRRLTALARSLGLRDRWLALAALGGAVLAVIAWFGVRVLADTPASNPGGSSQARALLANAQFTGTLTARNVTTNQVGYSDSVEAVLNDVLLVRLHLTNTGRVGFAPLTVQFGYQPPSEQSSDDPTDEGRIYVKISHGSEVTTLNLNERGTPVRVSVPDGPCTGSTMHAMSREVRPVDFSASATTNTHDSSGWGYVDPSKSDLINSYEIADFRPGESIDLELPIRMVYNIANSDYAHGSILSSWKEPRGVMRPVHTVRRGARLAFRLLVMASACDPDPRSPNVRVQIETHPHDAYVRLIPHLLSSTLTTEDREASENAVDDRAVTVNFAGGSDLRLRLVAGSTLLEAPDSSRNCRFTVLRSLDDGITQGGINIGFLPANNLRAPCASDMNERHVYFEMVVE